MPEWSFAGSTPAIGLMKLYRICTENKNYSAILDQLDIQFPNGYTIINANGAWQGQREKSLVIEIVANSPATFYTPIEKFVYWLKKHNNQQAVMVQTIEIDSQLL